MSEQNQNAVTTHEGTMAERFTNKVMALFAAGVGEVALTSFQKRLAQNYFIGIDASLTAAEEKRKAKKEDKRDPVSVTWANVNMDLVARNVVSFARVGLDPMQKNHVSLIPFKENATGKYNITFMPGYRGIELKAKKYGLDVPDAVIVELVYSNDKFKSIKKSQSNPVESFEFEVVNDFDRGEIVGGFYYHIYSDKPEKNKLVVFSRKDIEKRKPTYASVEFWGGEKTIWKDGKPVGKEQVEGWFEKMCYKTIHRAAYDDITIDSQKIDDDYIRLKQLETEAKEIAIEEEIAANANTLDIDIEAVVVPESPDPAADPAPKSKPQDPQQQTLAPTGTDGPGF